jgi:hypothetical protein
MDLSAELGYWPSPSQEAVAKSWCECRVDDLAAYGQLLAQHRGTCPMEAVDPLTIEPGQPATPAHLKLLASIGARLAPRGITPP